MRLLKLLSSWSVLLVLSAASLSSHAADYEPPRTAAGKPDFNGVWQVLNNANYNVEPDNARAALQMRAGPVVPVPAKELVALGAVGAVPASLGVIVDQGEEKKIPYQVWALKQRDDNRAHWIERDPEVKCYLPGVPRASYMPHPFRIVHNDDALFFSYSYAGAVRNIHLSDPGPAPIDSWMGQSWARWDGDTLVIETTGQNDQTWLDRAGNFHSELLKVTERYTRSSDHTITYEVRLEDDKVYTQPWTMRMTLYKRVGEDDRVLQFNCVELVEEMFYGKLRKHPVDGE